MVAIESGVHQPLPPRSTTLEVHRYESQKRWDAVAKIGETLDFPLLRARAVDFENPEARGDLRLSLGEG